MRKLLCVSGVMVLLVFSSVVRSQQQGGVAPGPAGQVGYILLPSPTVPDVLADSQPIPRLRTARWASRVPGSAAAPTWTSSSKAA
jgi:hypothetical protein